MKQESVITKLIIGLMLFVIIAYLVLAGVKTLVNPHRLVMVYSDMVENSLTVNGWIFRDELRLDSATGLINYRLDEGEKAASGEIAAVSYTSQEALSRQQKIRTISTEFAQLDYALSDEGLSGKNLENQLLISIQQMESGASEGDFTRLHEQANEYKRLVLRREYLYSEASASALGQASLAITKELNGLQQYTKQDAQIIYAPEPGLFSSSVDGYETLFAPDKLKEIMASDFQTLVKQAPESNDGAVGKLTTGSVWYYAMVVKEEDVPQFQKHNQVLLRLTSLAEPVPMSVCEVGYAEDGKAVVTLSSRKNLAQVIALREQAGSVIFQSEQGLRIPKKALRVKEDGTIGVYTVTAYRAEFKPVKVVAEDQDDYLVKANPKNNTDKRILRSGDEVIITAAELYEGKVVR